MGGSNYKQRGEAELIHKRCKALVGQMFVSLLLENLYWTVRIVSVIFAPVSIISNIYLTVSNDQDFTKMEYIEEY